MLRNFFAREDAGRQMEGQTLVEYALIIALVSVALILALGTLSGQIGEVFTFIGEELGTRPE